MSQPTVRKGIQSVSIAFKILDCLAYAGRAIPLKSLAKKTGMPVSNLSFYLVSLVETGMAQQDEQSGYYSLGPHALQLGLAFLEQFDALAQARKASFELAEELGHTVFLGVWGTHGPTIVHRVEGRASKMAFQIRVGSVLPIVRSALGRVFLTYLRSVAKDAILKEELGAYAASKSKKNVWDQEKIQRLITETSRHGISRSRGDLMSEYTAISAPILDHTGMPVAAITIMGPIGDFDDNWNGVPAKRLKEWTTRLSQQLRFSSASTAGE
jgi:DNA-binding IclR family transcriptional regulator